MDEPEAAGPAARGARPVAAPARRPRASRPSALTSTEATLLASRLMGLPSLLGGPWTWKELQRLAFLRWLVDGGRLDP